MPTGLKDLGRRCRLDDFLTQQEPPRSPPLEPLLPLTVILVFADGVRVGAATARVWERRGTSGTHACAELSRRGEKDPR